jgi:uncharacterized repeat protein (TIGR03803 family)
MSKGIRVGLTTGKMIRLFIALILLALAGRALNANAQTESILWQFGASFDGTVPLGGLVQGNDGNFYGTTRNGGTNNNNNGTVFRISPSGSYASLHSFGSLGGSPGDGWNPWVGLVQGSDGNFYGTTRLGGNTNLNIGQGYGTVFRISPGGTCTTLYSFGNSPADGTKPEGGLVQGSDGNLYGTCNQGGTYGDGTVFRISPSGNYTQLYSFAGYFVDGSGPP